MTFKPYITTLLLLTLTALVGCAPQNNTTEGPTTARERNLMHLAQTMYIGGDVDGAIDLYLRAAAKSKHRIGAYMALAKIYADRQQPEKAEEFLLAAKERQPNNPLVNLELGKIAISNNDGIKAIEYFEDGLAEDPDNIDLLNGKAVSLDMLAQHEEAQTTYLQALQQQSDRDNSFIYNNLAMSYIMDGAYEAAIAQLEGIKDMDKYPVMRQNLALAYGLKGDMKNARKWGLKDLTEKQIRENMDFYKKYTAALQQQQMLESED